MIECGQCGWELPPIRNDGLYYDGDEHVCPNDKCKATNFIGVDGPDDDNEWDIYVIRWRCQHDVLDDEECALCEKGSQ